MSLTQQFILPHPCPEGNAGKILVRPVGKKDGLPRIQSPQQPPRRGRRPVDSRRVTARRATLLTPHGEPAAGAAGAGAKSPQIGDGSVVRGDISLGDGARIGRHCIVEGRVRIGERTRIDDHCIVRGRVTMGADNWIYPFCTVGTGPQHSAHPEDPWADPAADAASGQGRGEIVMGSGNIMRGYASINLPAMSGCTTVGSGCHLLAYSHVAHDCNVHDRAILSAGAILGGHTEVGAGAHLGLGTMVHPRTRIGRLAMVGLRGAVVRDVPPFALINAGRFTKINTIGMERAGMSAAQITEVERAYEAVAAGGGGGEEPAGGGGGEEPAGGGGVLGEIRRFIASSKRGCYPPLF